MYGLQIKPLRFFITTSVLRPIAVFTGAKGNTAPLPNICHRLISNTWNGGRFRKWAEQIGENTYRVIDAILTSKRVEQQSYRSCMGLLKLTDKYSAGRLEAACRLALSFTAAPSYKSVKNILDTGNDRSAPPDSRKKPDADNHSHALTRGADYYRR